MKTSKIYYIVQTNNCTKEKLIFGEIKCKAGDAHSLKHLFSDKHHSYDTVDKNYCKNNNINPLEY